jgi:hypothetical protein
MIIIIFNLFEIAKVIKKGDKQYFWELKKLKKDGPQKTLTPKSSQWMGLGVSNCGGGGC